MPDDPEETMPEEEGAVTPQAKSKISLKTLILIGLPLIIVQALAAFVVVKKFVQPILPEQKPVPVEEVKQTESQDDQQVDLSEQVPVEVADIIVNPAETQGQRYLSVSVVYYVPEEIAADLTDFEAEVRSAIIEKISRKRLDELDDPGDREVLIGEVRDALNSNIRKFFSKKFPDLNIRRILFSKYTLQ